MRSAKRITVLILFVLGTFCGRLQAATHTNVIFNVSIAMTTSQQDVLPASSNLFFYVVHKGSFATAGVANALANTPLFRTNHLEGAKLLFRVSDLGPDRTAQFILRKGTNDVDVSSYINLSFPGATVTAKTPTSDTTTNATDYTLFDLNVGMPSGNFDVQGFCIVKNTSVFNGRELIQSQEFPATITAKVAGTGYAGGKPTMFRGTVLISGRRVEIKED